MILVEHRVAEALPLVDRVVVLVPGAGVLADGAAGAGLRHARRRAGRAGRVGAGFTAPRRAAAAAAGRRAAAPTAACGSRPRLSNLDFLVRAGEALAVLGPNGAGKSTLALLLGGLLRPDGRDGHRDRRGWPAPTRHAAVALAGGARWPGGSARCSRTPSTSSSPRGCATSWRSARAAPAGRRRGTSTVDELLARLRLDRLAAANPYTLSGGEQRRLSRRDRAGHRAGAAGPGRADVRPGPADLARAGRPARRPARRRARRGAGHPRRRRWSTRWPTAGSTLRPVGWRR